MKMIRQHLWVDDLLDNIRLKFDKIKDIGARRSREFSLTDCLMSGVAIFGMKYASLLQFDKDARENEVVRSNLKSLYKINKAPSDTQFRERLDVVDPEILQRGLNAIITQLQRGKVLESYTYIDNMYLVPMDGTGFFSSHDVHCDNCCKKEHKDGTVTYYHQALSTVIASPEYKQVFPLAMEFIQKQDGASKNDCELNAAKRMITKIKTSHPHLKIRMVCDALYANGPLVKLFKENDMGYIITATESNHAYLFDAYRNTKISEYKITKGDVTHIYKFVNRLPINDTYHDVLVNFVEYKEIKNNKTIYYSSWITDIKLSKENIRNVVKGARCRWKIENETFNTLKNQGYNFEHNFGHGNNNLSAVMVYLMMIAFAIDQVQEHTSKYFELALKKEGRKLYLWNKIKRIFLEFIIDSWETLYRVIIEPLKIDAKSLLSSP